MIGGRPATRYELLKARRRLDRVRHGAEVLGRKRRALVSEIFRVARAAAETRDRLADRAGTAYPILLRALAEHGAGGLTALGWPEREIDVTIRMDRVWGVGVAQIVDRSEVLRSLPARGTAPGTVGPAAAGAADAFEELIELLIDAATREMLLGRLADALRATSRQLNTLEQRVAPQLARQVAETGRALEEREREEHVRIRNLLRTRRG